MRASGKWWVLVFSAAIVVGCTASPRSAEPQALELAEAVCAFASRCCTLGEMQFYIGPFVEQADCAERLVDAAALDTSATFGGVPGAQVSLPNLNVLDRAIKEGRVRLNRGAIDACVAWLNEQSCNSAHPPFVDGVRCGPPAPITLSPCHVTALVEGRVPVRGACTRWASFLECQEGLVCLRDPFWNADEGTCIQRQRVDEWCVSDEHCAPGLYCSNSNGTCQVPAALGEACLYSVPGDPSPSESLLLVRCEFGLTCSPLTSTCVAPCEPGSHCSDDEECGEGTGLVCVESGSGLQTVGFCYVPRAAGEQCSEDEDCDAALHCALEPNTSDFSCQPRLANGEVCSDDDACQSGICAYGVFTGPRECVMPGAVGAYCEQHPDCASGFCDLTVTSECAATVANGQACSSGTNEECTDGYCAFDPGLSGTYCFALVAMGGACMSDDHCSSGACVAGACASRPLSDGERCGADLDCESDFCNRGESEPRCRSRPLADGSPCAYSDPCESQACFEGTCQPGATSGAPCGEEFLPCDPDAFFCDVDLAAPVCTPYRETGESCVRDLECRRDCTVRWGRRVCSLVAGDGEAVCDGR